MKALRKIVKPHRLEWGKFGRGPEEMPTGELSVHAALHGLQLVEHELMLFALFWFIVGAVDELAIDLVWLWLRLTGRARTPRLAKSPGSAPLQGRIALFVPASFDLYTLKMVAPLRYTTTSSSWWWTGSNPSVSS